MKSFGGSIPEAAMTFEANEGEKIFGMGQRQLSFLELKGAELELCPVDKSVAEFAADYDGAYRVVRILRLDEAE